MYASSFYNIASVSHKLSPLHVILNTKIYIVPIHALKNRIAFRFEMETDNGFYFLSFFFANVTADLPQKLCRG